MEYAKNFHNILWFKIFNDSMKFFSFIYLSVYFMYMHACIRTMNINYDCISLIFIKHLKEDIIMTIMPKNNSITDFYLKLIDS